MIVNSVLFQHECDQNIFVKYFCFYSILIYFFQKWLAYSLEIFKFYDSNKN